MNHIYRSIWNKATGAYAAVSENVKSAGKSSIPGSSGGGAAFALKALAASLMLGFGSLALAGPTGGTVVAGQAQIVGAPGSTTINQGSQNAVINWANFNIGANESVRFNQPNSNSVALNRVLGSDGTTILGNLSANGKVFIVNPNGILFGQGASVNTAGLVGSTLDISNADFMSGNYKFTGNGAGRVLNQGSISAPGGYVALLGANVSNEGTIQARLGSVALAAGRAITLDVAGDGLLNVTVDQGAVGALVSNGGLIRADGGNVLLSAQAAGDLLKTVVNNTGIIEAQTIDTKSGTIKLLGDMQSGTVNAAGTLDASAPTGGKGGFIDTSAAHVKLDDALKVTTASSKGASGTWLIDPTDYTIAATGGDQTGAFFTNVLKSTSVQIQSISGGSGTLGNINVNDTISWSANQLKLTAQNNININQPLRGSGTASLALEYGQQAAMASNLSTYNVKAEIDLPSGLNFSTKLGNDGTATVYTVINSLGAANSTTGTDLQGLRNTLNGNFVLGANIDASGTANTVIWGANGFTSIGTNTVPFTGQFDGLGHVITGLNSSTTASAGVAGLFGANAGSIRNIGLVAPVIAANISGTQGNIGALSAFNSGTISNTYVSGGTVTVTVGAAAGGLVARNSGSISDSRNSSTVTVTGDTDPWLGGLVAANTTKDSKIENSYNTGVVSAPYVAAGLVGDNYGSIINSFNRGNVTAGTGAGGLVNQNRATGVISNSFNIGVVTGSSWTGGLVSNNLTSGQILNSYSTGAVTANKLVNSGIGGLVGGNSGIISNSYATGTVTGGTIVGGVVGNNSASSSVSNVYSSGAVTLLPGATGDIGGVIGKIASGSNPVIGGGYYNKTLNPTLNGIGVNSGSTFPTSIIGLTSAEMQVASNFSTFTFTSTTGAAGNNWVMVNNDGTLNGAGNATGATGPMLAAEYSTNIYSSHQLQLMAMNLAGNYTLKQDINAASTGTTNDVWNGGTFVPVGANTSRPFTGTFDGTGHVISGLVINRPSNSYGGLFGVTSGTAIVRNVGLEGGSVIAGDAAGALVGLNQGLVDGSYSTGSVSGGTQVGGLVGGNGAPGIVSNSYASGAVSGTSYIGGLVGTSSGTLTNNYASGTVTGGNSIGGLTSFSNGAASGNFWDTTTSAVPNSAAGTGLSTAQMKLLSTYTGPGWNLASTWIVYDTNTYPLLRAFMTPLQVTFASNATKTYDGTSNWTAPGATYSNPNAVLQGSLNYGAAGSAVNAGTYAITAGGLYSGQRGYAISSNAATLTIDKLGVTLSGATVATRDYNGTTAATLVGGSLSGVLSQDTANVTYNTGTFNTKDVGTGKAVTATTTGSASGNYIVSATGLTGTITQKALTVTGLAATTKVYDNLASATVTGGTFVGLVSGETLNLGTSSGTYQDANAGTNKTLTVTLGTVSNGSGLASNYSITSPGTITGTITPKALSWASLSVGDKEYDGNTTASISKATISGLVGSQELTTSRTATFADQNAGNNKTVTVHATLSDGGSGGTTGLASNYTFADATVTASITPKALTVSGAVAGNKTYDGTKAAAITGGTLGGMIGSETVGLGALSGSFADQNAGNGIAVTVTGGTLSDGSNGGLASNYTVGSVTGLSANITQKTLTVSGVTVASKAYDGDTKATISGGTLNGLVSGETLTLSGQSGTFNDQNAGNGKAVTVTGATLGNGSGLASNYTVSNATGATGNITRKALTVTGATASDKVYDGSTAATINGGALSGLVGSETLGLSSLAGTFVDKNAASGKTVTVTGGTLSDGTGGGLASNYTVGPVTGLTASITQKALTVSGMTVSAKTYDGNTKASVTGGTLNGLVTGETLSVSGQTGTFNNKDAGTGKAVTVTGTTLVDGSGLASNYSVTNPTGVTGDITQKALTVTGVTGTGKVYDGTTKATVSGGSLSGLVGSETLSLSGLSGAFADKNVGTGKGIVVTGATLSDGTGLASNYSVSNPTGVTANITQASISAVSNIVASDKVYDGNTKATVSNAGATFAGMVNGDALTVSATSAAFADKNAGSGKTVNASGLTLGGTDVANYVLTATTGSGTAAITPKALTIINMTAGSKVYNGNTTASLLGGSISGLVGTESVAVSGLTAAFDNANVGTGKTVTVSGATLGNGGGGGLAANYTISNPTGLTANITPKALTVTGMTAGSKVYDGTTAATLAGGNLSGLVGSETLVISGGSGVFVDKNAGNGKAVTVSGVSLLDGTGLASNYTVSNPTSVTGNITQKVLTVTGALASDKTYDGALGATITGGSLSGTIGTETVGLSSLTGTFVDKNAGSGKAVSITGGVLSDGSNGGLASNYSVGTVTGLSASIAQKALTVTGVAGTSKVYDGTTKATVTGGSLSGLVGGETLGLSGLAGAFADKNAGIAKGVIITGATLSDGTGLASNYSVSNPTGVTANISQASISAVSNIVAGDKVYDGNTKATVSNAGATFAGMVNGDALTVSATSAAFADKNAGSGKTVNASGLTLGGTDVANYVLTATTGSGTAAITPKALSIINMTAGSKVYNGNTTASLLGGSISGLVGTESVAVSGLTAAFDNANVGTGKTVTVSGATLGNGGGGGLAANYTISNPTGLTANITPKALTVTGMTAGSKVYDGTTAATLAGGNLSGLVGSETLVISGGSGVFVDKNAGNGKAVTVSGVSLLDGTGLASNYTVSNPTGVTGNITQKVLTVTGSLALDKTYDGTRDATITGGTLGGFVGLETVGLTGLSGAFGDKNAGNDKAVNITGATLANGSNGGLGSNYTVAGSLTASIAQKALSVTGVTAGNKVYDSTTKATVTGGALSGLVGSETLGLSGLSGAFGDKNAGTDKAIIVSGATLADGSNGGLASNYTVSNPIDVKADIAKANITGVTGFVGGTKVYDATTTATVSNAGATFAGMFGGDALTVSATSADFIDKNAGSGKVVNASGLSLGGADAGNYNLTAVTGAGTGSITQAQITGVTGIIAGSKTYDATTTATVSSAGATFAGMFNGDALNVSATSANFTDKNAGSGKAVNASGLSLGGADAGNYNLTAVTGAGTGSITQAQITGVTGIIAGSKTYDATTTATVSNAGATFAGMFNGDALNVSATSANFVDKNAGSGKVVNATGLSLGGADAGNYNLTAVTGSGTGTITQAQIASVSGITAVTKTYDGSDAATLNAGATYNGLLGSDSLSFSATKATFSDKNAATGKTVNVEGIVLGGTDAGNYTLASTIGTGTGDIAKAVITGVSGIAAGDKVYDGTRGATLDTSGATFAGMVAGDQLSASGAGLFADKNAATGKTVTISDIALAGADAGNYTLSANTASTKASISQATITGVAGITAGDKVYDGTRGATLDTSGATFAGMVAGDQLSASGAGLFADKNAATGKTVTISDIVLAGADAGNYSLSASTASTKASISQASITGVTGILAGSKVYDTSTKATVSNAGATFAGMVNGDALNVSAASATFNDKNAGSGKVVNASGLSLGGADAGNYNLTAVTGTGTGTITQAQIASVSGITAVTKTYDGSDAATLNAGATYNGVLGSDSLSFTATKATFSDKNAGTKTVNVEGIVLGGTDAGNYSLASSIASGTGAITPKALTVTGATAGNKVYDGTLAASVTGGALSGLVGGETLSLSGLTGTFASQNAASNIAVTASGATLANGTGLASNYTVSNPTGLTASITPKALTVTGQLAGNKVYDGNAVASLTGGVLSGLVGGEALNFGGQVASFGDKNAANGKAVTVTGTTLVDTASGLASNYTVSNPTGLTASITPKALTVSGQLAGNKVYDGNTVASLSGGALSGLVDGETLGFGGQSAVFSDKNAANGKTVTVTGTTLLDTASGLASNYTVSNPTGLSASITAKALTVTGQLAGNKVYDGNTVASLSGGALSGLVGGETLGFAGQTAVFSDKNAANGKTVTVTGTTLVDTATGLASNYTVSNPTGLSASITAKALTVTGQLAGNKVYDGNTVASLSGGALSGLVGGETLGFAGQTAVFSDKNAANGKSVTVTGTTLVDTATGLASNYTVSNPTGLTASITAKALTVTGQLAGNKVYDGNTVASLSGGALSGLVGGETLGFAGQTAVFSDKNAANGKTVTVTGTTLVDTATGLASNYTVSNPTGLTASITPKAVTITGQLAGNKVYDGNAVASLTGGVLNGLVGSEALNFGGQVASFSDKNAANGKAVTVTGTTLLDTASGLASNYTVSNPTGLTASITPKALTVTGQLAGNKVYDGNAVASLTGGVLSGLVGSEVLNFGGQVASFSDKNAANGKAVTVTGTTLLDTASGLASNYTVSNPTGLTASITPKALTVTGQLASNKVYDGNATASLSGGSLNGLVAGETLGIAGQSAAFADKNAANGKAVTVSGTTLVDGTGSASNYTVSNPTGLSASITPASLVIRATGASRAYDTTTNASVTLSDNRIAGDVLTISNSGARFADKNAGVNKTITVNGIALAGADAGNYVVSSTVSTTASISQVALGVKVDNAEKDQGRANPDFSATYTGLLAGDTLANEVSGNLAYATNASTASPAGNYLVSASGQSSVNYALTYTPGVLTVQPTEVLQSALASVIGTVNVAPSQGNMVQADMVATGERADSKADVVAVATGESNNGNTGATSSTGNGPTVQLTGAVTPNVLPGLRLNVIDTGLRLPGGNSNTSLEAQ
ncbi:YDG domain-containing protein [Janthinobacterium aquaticum]|uniref:YDG domain-containing protein n=1 Tax=Janthinobacterium sp. FT58W TaxID=2654254 RepID=UPI0012642B19|nr:YDG domain-containing protein [Janthinobacterium sp. FT58W]KAB8042756.1 filamentous hemagglutinin N-terminal domain-containing protein [Janthinobacterium sp. FT58W]